ncbi:MAG: LysR family transcriptional regulator [Yoonia sp.]|nr:LysR family transcriptional regulator [Yoonia sp.]
MDNWDEIRTAYQVARNGTVSGAAEALGVHHATVIRHIDALEGRLGVKLFQRHARGYTATEAGNDLLVVAQATEDQFTQLAGRIKGQGEGVSGDLVITSLGELSRLLTPALVAFQEEHPDVRVRFLTGERLFRLEYGEAHVAIRAGDMPDQPDNVVQPFLDLNVRLVASKGYISRHGMPASEADLRHHRFVGHYSEVNRAPFNKWLRATVGDARIVYQATDERNMVDAILAGAGIGFLSDFDMTESCDLVEVIAQRADWASKLWLVTHVDLHRTSKVQAILAHLKVFAKSYEA